jgi:hypothetical protein
VTRGSIATTVLWRVPCRAPSSRSALARRRGTFPSLTVTTLQRGRLAHPELREQIVVRDRECELQPCQTAGGFAGGAHPIGDDHPVAVLVEAFRYIIDREAVMIVS